ncbi:cupin domain-containing protein [Sporosarcina trichiuri]|uniref:cupin domain-containing protein n=1 Tax=Sporosarcina trichiuri TaxID=3056445 RepID=UPI003D66D5FA
MYWIPCYWAVPCHTHTMYQMPRYAAESRTAEPVRRTADFPERRSRDQGSAPYVFNIQEATVQNNTFRTAMWTGEHLQVTLMSIGPGESVGLEVHPQLDQFLRVEEGQGTVHMGKTRDCLDFCRNVEDDDAILIPGGMWHNLVNTGAGPLKLYSIYAPPNHPFGTVHVTKAEADAAEVHADPVGAGGVEDEVK